jgi:hypothetical protein
MLLKKQKANLFPVNIIKSAILILHLPSFVYASSLSDCRDKAAEKWKNARKRRK